MPSSRMSLEENWEQNWKSILENPDGTLNLEQLKKELHDFSMVLDEVPKVYTEISGQRLSYATYPANTVIQCYKQHLEEMEEHQKADDQEDGLCSFCDQELPKDESRLLTAIEFIAGHKADGTMLVNTPDTLEEAQLIAHEALELFMEEESDV